MKIEVIPADPLESTMTPAQRKENALRRFLQTSAQDALFVKKLLDDPPAYTELGGYGSIRRVLVRAFLIHAAMCSRLLFPTDAQSRQRKRDKALAQSIRASFGIEDSSPLNDRDVRDSFEHMDERLEHWAEQANIDEPITDWYVPAFEVEIPPDFEKNLFGAYLGSDVVTPNRDGSVARVNTDVLANELRKIA